MKKFLVLALICAATVVSVRADDDPKTVRKDLIAKYDTNKDGKLDKEEKSKMTAEDKAKWDKVAMGHKKKKDDAAAPAPAPAAPDAK